MTGPSKELIDLKVELQKKYGANRVMFADEVPVYPMISSGSLALDLAIGGGLPQDRCIEVAGEERSGKALDLSTPLPTPTGWTTMGKVEVGDLLYDEKGNPTEVTATFDVEPEESYRVIFNDHTEVVACGDHLWTTWTELNRSSWFSRGVGVHQGRYPEDWPNYTIKHPRTYFVSQKVETRTTKELLATLKHVARTGTETLLNNHSIPVTKPLQCSEKPLPIDPWVLGYWLGNGATNDSSISCHAEDESEVQSKFVEAGFSLGEWRSQDGNAVDFSVLGLSRELRVNNLYGNKHVPEIYLRGSVEQRRALLSGLLDSDGYHDKSGQVEFSSTLKHLAEAVYELATSLSQKPVMREGVSALYGKAYGPCWYVVWNPTENFFTVERKRTRFRPVTNPYGVRRQARFITDIVQVSNRPMRCVMVDSPNHLYLAGKGMIPTHNTTLGLTAMVNFLDYEDNKDRYALILDVEHKLTIPWVETLIGSERMKRVVIMWPTSIENATDMYRDAITTDKFCFCLFDSIGGAPTIKTQQTPDGKLKSAETANMGGNALGVQRFAQTAEILSHVHKCLTFGINQVRDDFSGYNQHITPGGRAWKHACALRLLIKRVPREEVFEKIDGEDVRVGFKVVGKAVKNHLPGGIEDRKGNFWFYNIWTEKYGFGVDRTDEVVRLSVLAGIVDQRGSWYYHPALNSDGRIQSLGRLIELVKSDVTLRETLTSELMVNIAENSGKASAAVPEEELTGLDLLAVRNEDA